MEQLTAFISSRGILKSCRSHNAKPTSSSPQIDLDLLDRHVPGGTIYVCTEALRNFSDNLLPSIRVPFTLITGDADTAFSQPLLDDSVIIRILSSNLLVSWYAQNLSAQHPKLFQIPIGLDYHTMWERPGAWGISAISAISQENALLNTLASSPEFSQRYMAAYCNWRAVAGWGDRLECYEKIDRSVCLFETNSVPRNSTWLRQSECMFVVSPEGIGMDCHRTWEAILLGCIPIIKKNALSSLFSELPVLIVENWGDANRNAMLEYIKTLTERKFNFSTLFREYWMRKVTGQTTFILDPMTCAEFRKFLTRKTG